MNIGRVCSSFVLGSIFSLLLAGCSGANSDGGRGTPPSTASITSVAVSCNPPTVSTTQTSQCAATVSGTGSYSPAVIWSATNGTITAAGLFTPKSAGSAAITATSAEDTTKSGPAAVTVTAPTTLAIVITDLPAGTPGNVTVTDPNGQQVKLTASQTLNAIPGAYTLTSAPVVAGGSTYSATLATQTANVTSGDTTTATVDYYNIIPSTTKILDQTGAASLAVSSDKTTLMISASSPVAQSLAPGDVIVVPPSPAGGVAPMGLLRKIITVSSSNSEIVVTTQQATLAEAFARLSFQIQDKLNAQAIQSIRPSPGVTFHAGATLPRVVHMGRLHFASQPLSDPCAGSSLGVFDASKSISSNIAPGLTLSGQVELCSSLNFSIDITGQGFLNLQPTLNALTATATMGQSSDLTLQGTFLAGFFNPSPIMLGTLTFPPIAVPGLPVWVTPEVTVFAGANGNLSTDVSTEVNSSGTFTRGVSYASGAWSPVQPPASLQFGYQPPTLDTSLSAKAYAGVEFDLLVYDIVGPSFKPDGYLSLDADISKNPWWTLTAGLEGPMSFDVTILGDNLASYDLGTMFDYSTLLLSAPGPFAPPPAPVVQSLSPQQVTVGGASFNLAITGSNFVQGAVVNFGTAPLAATGQSSSQLSTTVPSNLISSAGKVPVSVTNPGSGAGTSNSINFTVISGGKVTITPASVSVLEGGIQTFTATVAGGGGVNWSLQEGSSGGSINNTGTYTAPNTTGTFHVIATNEVDSSQNAVATVTVTMPAALNEWTWMGGSNTAGAPAVYGTQGVASTSNTPGARDSAVTWTDNSGNFWLFGGEQESGGTPDTNDLWKFNPSTREWAWVSGSNTTGSAGSYGTKGVASNTNVPPARGYDAASWTDQSGNLWLFGGYGDSGEFNDLWEFNTNSKEWTWISGSNSTGAASVYGTQGVAAAANVPGARDSAVGWIDNGGNFWLFGGEGPLGNGPTERDDLWEFNPTTRLWTWMGGNGSYSPGVYGTRGIASPTNFPGSRTVATGWTDHSGNFWLFGGHGAGGSSEEGFLNDLSGVQSGDPAMDLDKWEQFRRSYRRP